MERGGLMLDASLIDFGLENNDYHHDVFVLSHASRVNGGETLDMYLCVKYIRQIPSEMYPQDEDTINFSAFLFTVRTTGQGVEKQLQPVKVESEDGGRVNWSKVIEIGIYENFIPMTSETEGNKVWLSFGLASVKGMTVNTTRVVVIIYQFEFQRNNVAVVREISKRITVQSSHRSDWLVRYVRGAFVFRFMDSTLVMKHDRTRFVEWFGFFKHSPLEMQDMQLFRNPNVEENMVWMFRRYKTAKEHVLYIDSIDISSGSRRKNTTVARCIIPITEENYNELAYVNISVSHMNSFVQLHVLVHSLRSLMIFPFRLPHRLFKRDFSEDTNNWYYPSFVLDKTPSENVVEKAPLVLYSPVSLTQDDLIYDFGQDVDVLKKDMDNKATMLARVLIDNTWFFHRADKAFVNDATLDIVFVYLKDPTKSQITGRVFHGYSTDVEIKEYDLDSMTRNETFWDTFHAFTVGAGSMLSGMDARGLVNQDAGYLISYEIDRVYFPRSRMRQKRVDVPYRRRNATERMVTM